MGSEILVRRLGDADVTACVALCKTVGWRSSDTQWKMMLGVGDAFGAEIDGALVGTVIINRFGTALASVAMMVVCPTHQRRGVGRSLMVAGLEHARGASVFLYATDVGRILYESLGFALVSASRRVLGPLATATPLDGARPMRSLDLPGVYALDEESQGAPRRSLIDALVANVERASVIERDGSLVGYGLATINDGRRILGPIVARDDDAARTIAAHLCVGSDLPVCLDLDPDDEALSAWAERGGLKLEGTTSMMILGGKPLPGCRQLIRALAGRAFG